MPTGSTSQNEHQFNIILNHAEVNSFETYIFHHVRCGYHEYINPVSLVLISRGFLLHIVTALKLHLNTNSFDFRVEINGVC